MNKKLARQIYQAKYQREKFRPEQKLKLERAGSIDKSLLPRSGPGRPRLSEHQLGLPEAITAAVTADNNKVIADPRRRSEVIRSYMRLDDLVTELQTRGFTIKRTGTCLRLLPKRSSSIQGRLHVETVPFKLIRPQNNFYEKHPDADFCFSLV